MILFASGRCDICAYYSEWLIQRVREGFVDVRNPFNEHQISRIYINASQVDCIVFCTKNPKPIFPYLEELKQFPLLFHVTLTPYHQDIEKNVVHKKQIIQNIIDLSKQLGSDHVIVRYDPILFTSRYSLNYHACAFEKMCQALEGYVTKFIISFVDMYKNTRMNAQKMGLIPIDENMMRQCASYLAPIAQKYHIQVQTCAEAIDLSEYGIKQGACFDAQELEKIIKHPLNKRMGVRKQCQCIESVDIGDYNCCNHGCLYCYANYDETKINQRMKKHLPTSSVLLGKIEQEDVIHIRKEKKIRQLQLID